MENHGSSVGPGRCSVSAMLFMVIEHFKNGDPKPIGDRFRVHGRMLPENVVYHASWIDTQNSRCFQIMESPDRESLEPWIAAWADLVDFEVIPVQHQRSSGRRFSRNRYDATDAGNRSPCTNVGQLIQSRSQVPRRNSPERENTGQCHVQAMDFSFVSLILSLTTFLMRVRGRGLSSGSWIAPFEVV